MLGDLLKDLRTIHSKMKEGKNDEAFSLLCSLLGEEPVKQEPVKKKRGRPKKVKKEEPTTSIGISSTSNKKDKKVSFKKNRFEEIAPTIKIEEEEGADKIDDSAIITQKRPKTPSKRMRCTSCQK